MDFLDNINNIPSNLSIDFTKPATDSKNSVEFSSEKIENFDFGFAPVRDPSLFCESIKQSSGDEKKIMNFHKGTTTLGITLFFFL